MESKKTDWNQAALEHLFGQMDISPVDSPLVIDCNGYGRAGGIFRAVSTIRQRLEAAGFFGVPEMCLIVPTGILPDSVAGHIDVFESDDCNDAYLFTATIEGIHVIDFEENYAWADRFYDSLMGNQPDLVTTMPWAHAKFINWKKEKADESD